MPIRSRNPAVGGQISGDSLKTGSRLTAPGSDIDMHNFFWRRNEHTVIIFTKSEQRQYQFCLTSISIMQYICACITFRRRRRCCWRRRCKLWSRFSVYLFLFLAMSWQENATRGILMDIYAILKTSFWVEGAGTCLRSNTVSFRKYTWLATREPCADIKV